MGEPYLEPDRIEYICRALCGSHLNPDALAFSTPLMDGAIYVVPENAPKLWETKIHTVRSVLLLSEKYDKREE